MFDNNKKNNDPKNPLDIPNFINYEDLDESDSLIKEVNSSLAKQIDTEFYEEEAAGGKRPKKKKKLSRLIKVPLSLLVVLIILCGLALFTSPGQKAIINLAGRYIYSNFEYQNSEGSQPAMSDEVVSGDVAAETTDSHVINILLIGIEEIEGDQNTDTMIIASMNTQDHSLKLTSLMRDLYVEIPGHSKGRLNSAYARGGIELLYETIKTNFGIQVDGYSMVNFKAFEQIVDIVGGVEISLTKEEADYLNHTNYISIKSNRKVVEGTQMMNGNQALGYCRVRKVPTSTESSDFGRTQRQRIVLQSIYDRLKSKNILQQVLILNDILTKVKVKTNVTQKEFISYLEEAASLKIKELETLRIPSDGSYKNKTVKMGSHNAQVLQPKSWDATRQEIYDFIYGEASDSVTAE